VTLSQKYPTQNKAGGMAQVVECLPSKKKKPEFKSHNHQKKKKKLSIVTLILKRYTIELKTFIYKKDNQLKGRIRKNSPKSDSS
jgi:hypothetical protein